MWEWDCDVGMDGTVMWEWDCDVGMGLSCENGTVM